MARKSRYEHFSEKEIKEFYNNSQTLTEFCQKLRYKKGDGHVSAKLKEKYAWYKGFTKYINLSGQRFGRLIALSPTEFRQETTGGVYWRCKCDCGNYVNVLSSHLRSGATQSCGCYRIQRLREESIVDLTGQRFGKLLVEKLLPYSKLDDGVQWECLCDCGNRCAVNGNRLKSGLKKSCGCLSTSYGAYLIEKILKENGFTFSKEFSFNNLIGKEKPLRFDFAIFEDDKIKCLIEFQGEQHYSPMRFSANLEKFNKQKENDLKKVEYCRSNNVPLLIIPYWEEKNLSLEFLNTQINNLLEGKG